MIRTGQQLAGYELEQLAAEGDAGVIYRARDIALQRPVALRIVAPDVARDPVVRARLNRELTTLASVDHPNVAPIYDTGDSGGRLLIASRWIDGLSVSALVHEQGPLEPRRAVRIVNQVASALEAAHAVGIMHRNVKPSTVLVTAADHVYLTDFGLARRSSDLSGLTAQEHLLESFDYVAPEYISGQPVDRRVDIYGLGCVLYEALTGEVPYPGAGPAAKMYAHRSSEPPSARLRRPEVPEALDAVVRRALAKDPAERQQSAGEFAIDAAGAVAMSSPLWATRVAPGGAIGDDGHVPSEIALPAPSPAGNGNGSVASAADEAGRDRLGRDAAPLPDAEDERPRLEGAPGPGLGSAAGADDDGLPVVDPDESPSVEQGAFAEPVYFVSRDDRSLRRRMLWAIGLLVFLAAPLALLIALATHA